MLKITIKNYTQKYAGRKKKSTNNELLALEKKLKFIEHNTHNSPLEYTEEQILAIRNDIQEIIQSKTQGAMARCKANWIEAGEKSSKHFFNLEKANYKKLVTSLILDDGTRITHNKRILEEQRKFYQILYTTKRDDLRSQEDYLKGIVAPKLTEDERLVLDEELVIEEVIESIKAIKSNKAQVHMVYR